ncbi:MAG: hypothetical protein J5861_03235 [Desulfovibrio sp.]|nr:hypothetical protein [Desulfovibrio sp.]
MSRKSRDPGYLTRWEAMRSRILLALVMAGLLVVHNTDAHEGVSNDEGWTAMPAGARPAFFGIHGGTMPVSLLVYGDGSSLVTFVGRTGNDFMEVLRNSDAGMPSLLRGVSRRQGQAASPSSNATAILSAGTGTDSLPVFNLSGEGFSRMAAESELQPFGLSDKPLSIEGSVTRPEHFVPVKQYRLFFQPQYLQPRRGRN